MTHAEIDAMDSCQWMDILIHEKVMGMGGVDATLGPASDIDKSCKIVPLGDMHPDYAEMVPSYSADITAALRVVEKLRERCTLVEVIAYKAGGSPQSYECLIDESADCRFSAGAETAPLAICRAALKAMMT